MQSEIKKIFSKIISINVDKIKPNTSIGNTKKWDSLAHMNLIMAFESEFKIKFTENEINEMLNYKIIEEIILNKK
jgi:acyl carrier protein|tara:strand:- start:1327 stop:1551 length:225 start_codon:yes stop_codon:yes gene_type:complete